MKKNIFIKKRLICITALLLTSSILWGCNNSNSEGANQSENDSLNNEQTESLEITDTTTTETTSDEISSGEVNSDETVSNETDQTNDNTTSAINQDELNNALIKHHYGEILSQITCALQLPEGDMIEAPYDMNFDMRDNSYAIFDVDGDGYEELIVSYSTASMAGMFEVIYGYNPETDTLTREFIGFPSLEFYDNGIIIAYASHNHSYGEFWPFGLYQYDSASDSYKQIAYVDTWDKTFTETLYDYENEQEIPFPTDLDTDNDGTLYNIQEGDSESYSWDYAGYQYNEGDYQEWYNSYMNNAQKLTPDYLSLDYENFKNYTKDYLSMLQAAKEVSDPSSGTDIGLLFTTGNRSLQDISQMLCDNYGITIEYPYEDFDDQWIGKYQEEKVFEFINLDLGCIVYNNTKIEDITIYDLYPGMEEMEASQKLASYGFYPNGGDNEIGYSFITGNGLGNLSIRYKTENGKITSISISPYCAYAG